MQLHFWIMLKIIDIIGQGNYIIGTELELQERRKTTVLMGKNI
jgi:hypothetical protein